MNLRKNVRTKLWAILAVGCLTTLGLVGCGSAGGGSNAVVDIAALKVVPDNALAVVLIKDLSQLDGKIAELGKKLNFPIPPVLATVKNIAQIKEGLDEKGTVVVALIPGTQTPPSPVVFIPVTDFDKFIGQLQSEKGADGISLIQLGPGPKSPVAKKGSYAVIVLPTSESSLKDILSAKADISSQLSSVSGWLAQQDIAAVATPAGIKLGIGPIRQGLQQSQQNFPADNPQAETVKSAFQAYDNLLKSADENLTHAGIGMRADKDFNLHITSRWMLKPDSVPAKSLASIKGAAGQRFNDLPAGPYVFAGGGTMEGMAEMYGSMLAASPQMMQGLSPEQMAELQKCMQEMMQGANSMEMVMRVPTEGGRGIYQNMIATMKVDNAAKYLERIDGTFAKMKTVLQSSKSPFFKEYELKPVTVSGGKGLELSMDLSAIMAGSMPADNAESVKKIMEGMFGPGGKMTVTYATVDDKTIAVFYVGGAEAEKQLAAYKSRSESLAKDAQTMKTLALLPADAQWVGVWNLSGTMAMVKIMASAFDPDAKIPLPELPAMPPLGFAAKASGNGFETDLVVPVDVLKNAVEFYKKSEL